MPLRALTGFEFGTTAGAAIGNAGNKIFDVVDGGVAFTSGAARTGGFGFHHDSNNTTQGVKFNTDTLTTSQTRLLTAFWFKFPTAVPDHDTPFWAMHCVGPDMAGWFISARDGRVNKLAISFDDITYFYQDNVNIVADTWYFLEAHWDVSVTGTPITWRVNGIPAPLASGASAPDTIAEVELGYINNLRTFICDYDDWAVWTDTATIPFTGKHKVVRLTPDASSSLTVNGPTTNWNTFSGVVPTETAWNATTALTSIGEVPPNLGSAQDGFDQIANSTTAYVEVPLTNYTISSGEKVVGGRLLVPGWAALTTAANLGFRSWNGTTETTLFAAADPNFDNSSTPAWVCKMLTAADIDTQAELDALAIRVGFSGATIPHIGVHAVYVELAISEPETGPPIQGTLSALLPGLPGLSVGQWSPWLGTADLPSISAQTLTPTGSASDEAFGVSRLDLTVLPVGIFTQEKFGNQITALNLSLVGAPSNEQFGQPTIQVVTSLTPTGILSNEAFGNSTTTLFLTPTGIPSNEQLGNVLTSLNVAPTGVGTNEQFGQPTIQLVTTINPTSIPTTEQFGSSILTTGTVSLSPTATPSTEFFGNSQVTPGAVSVSPTGLGSAEAFGSPTIQLVTTISPTGIVSNESFGQQSTSLTTLPTSINTNEQFGNSSVSQTISQIGISSSETFGLPTIQLVTTIAPVGVKSEEKFGQQAISFTSLPTGVLSNEAFGQQSTNMNVNPTNIPSNEVFGATSILIVTTVSPTGTKSDEKFGNAAVISSGALLPTGISSSESFGNIGISTGSVAVTPTGLKSDETFGNPSVTLGLQIKLTSIASTEAFGIFNIYRTADVMSDAFVRIVVDVDVANPLILS